MYYYFGDIFKSKTKYFIKCDLKNKKIREKKRKERITPLLNYVIDKRIVCSFSFVQK